MSDRIFKNTPPSATIIDLAARRTEKLNPAALRRAKKANLWHGQTLRAFNPGISHINDSYRAFGAYLLHLQHLDIVASFGLEPSPLEEINGEFWIRTAALELGLWSAEITFFSSTKASHATDADTDYPANKLQQTVLKIETDSQKFWIYANNVHGVPQVTNPAEWHVYSGPKDSPTIEHLSDFLARHHPSKLQLTPTKAEVAPVLGGALGTRRGRHDKRHLAVISTLPTALVSPVAAHSETASAIPKKSRRTTKAVAAQALVKKSAAATPKTTKARKRKPAPKSVGETKRDTGQAQRGATRPTTNPQGRKKRPTNPHPRG